MHRAALLHEVRLMKFGDIYSRRIAGKLAVFDTLYWDDTPKHFHKKLVTDHRFSQSDHWVRLTL